jgi:hypothetical protein
MRNISLLALAVTFVVTATLFIGCEQREPEAQIPATVTNSTAAVSTSSAEFEKLKGKWARMDGDYVLDIASVAASGQMEAAYFNPNPIKISRALGIVEGKDTKVFVELRDEGYPGCTYSLTYSAETDQLFGTYFQAAMQETFEVVFSRLK